PRSRSTGNFDPSTRRCGSITRKAHIGNEGEEAFVAKRTVQYKGFGVTVEVPEGVGRALRSLRPRPEAAPERLVVAPAPAVTVDARATEYEVMRSFADEAATITADRAAHADDGDEIASHFWYHTIELPDGEVTPGRFDHRALLPFYGLPDDLN